MTVLAVSALSACKRPASVETPAVSSSVAPSTTTGPASAAAPEGDELPPPARAVPVADLAGDFECGPWSTKDLEKGDRPLLEDRVRVQFFAGGTQSGDASSAKIQVTKDGHTLFVGARETFQVGDARFAQRATRAAKFGGDRYEPVTIAGRGGKISIVTGVRKDANDVKGESVALAHGWFLDPNRDVIDVALFVSAATFSGGEIEKCRRFAQKIVSTAALGARVLKYGDGRDAETAVSYARFSYALPPDWMVAGSTGIHDFARIRFRKRGTFPSGFVELQMALDSHPGDWTSPGEPDGERKGKLLGLPVEWHLTKKEDAGAAPLHGAWTKSVEAVRNDHAVASISASSAAERDDAIRFAESVRVGR